MKKIVMIIMLTVASGAALADGPFVGLRLNHLSVDYVEAGNPWGVDSERMRPAVFAGYRFPGGVELAVDHSRGSTGIAVCPPGPPCLAVAMPTRTSLTSLTAGYSWPVAEAWSLSARAGLESARIDFGSTGRRSEKSLLAGATVGYHLTSKWSVGLDVSTSALESRSIGAALRFDF